MNGRSWACAVKIWLKIALNAVRLPKFELLNGISWSPRKMMVKDLRQRSGLAWFCTHAESCVVFNTGPYTVLPYNSILITANMQSETGFPGSHQLKSYVVSKSRLKLVARCPVSGCWPSCSTDHGWDDIRVTTLPGKSWSLVRPFSRPGKLWKTAKVMESHGKWWWCPGIFWIFCKNALEFLFL